MGQLANSKRRERGKKGEDMCNVVLCSDELLTYAGVGRGGREVTVGG